MRSSGKALIVLVLLFSVPGCQKPQLVLPTPADTDPPLVVTKPLADNATPKLTQIIASAIEQTTVTTGYDPAYVGIEYPNGDVAPETGVCSDVVVRAFRKAGIDLQKEVQWGEHGTSTLNVGELRVVIPISITVASVT